MTSSAELTTKVTGLESSVEDTSSRISGVENSKLPNLKEEIDKVRDDLDEKLLLYEIHNRKQNLLIYGVMQQPNENVYEVAFNAFAHLLGISWD